MNTALDLSALDRAAGLVNVALRNARAAEFFLDPAAAPEETAKVPAMVASAADAAGGALRALTSLGATVPEIGLPPSIPLHLLDTADARALLAGLRDLLPVAERLDASRGRIMPEGVTTGPSESRGTDVADSLAAMIARLDSEVHGARGRE